MFAGLLGLIAAFLVLALILMVALYVYVALALSTIAKKLKYNQPWLAWIPVANLFLLPILAKKHWAWGFIFLVPIINIVFAIIWTWKIYERRGYPGALSLIIIATCIPVLGFLAIIASLIVLGIVAWNKK